MNRISHLTNNLTRLHEDYKKMIIQNNDLEKNKYKNETSLTSTDDMNLNLIFNNNEYLNFEASDITQENETFTEKVKTEKFSKLPEATEVIKKMVEFQDSESNKGDSGSNHSEEAIVPRKVIFGKSEVKSENISIIIPVSLKMEVDQNQPLTTHSTTDNFKSRIDELKSIIEKYNLEKQIYLKEICSESENSPSKRLKFALPSASDQMSYYNKFTSLMSELKMSDENFFVREQMKLKAVSNFYEKLTQPQKTNYQRSKIMPLQFRICNRRTVSNDFRNRSNKRRRI